MGPVAQLLLLTGNSVVPLTGLCASSHQPAGSLSLGSTMTDTQKKAGMCKVSVGLQNGSEDSLGYRVRLRLALVTK